MAEDIKRYILSTDIRVFPSIGRRPEYDNESELTNENNLSQIVRSLSPGHRESFVISRKVDTSQPFEFILYGFYFKVLDVTKLTGMLSDETAGELWAGIITTKIETSDNTSVPYQLLTIANSEGLEPPESLHLLDSSETEEDSVFQGVCFGSSENDVITHLGGKPSNIPPNIHTLQLLAGTSGSPTIPVKSLLHIRTDEILDVGGEDNKGENYISSTFTTGNLTTSNLTTSILTTTNATISSLNGTDASIGTLTVRERTSFLGDVNAVGKKITALIFEGNLTGKLTTARTISLSGDISGHAAFDASKDVTISTKIGTGKVGTAELATSAVTPDKVAADAITTDKINNSAVTTDKINTGAVTTDKIKDGAVLEAKIASSAVTTGKINDSAVTTEKIASDAVTTDKIKDGVVTASKVDQDTFVTVTPSDPDNADDEYATLNIFPSTTINTI